MLNEENLKAALKAEASLARVPAADLLNRIRQSGARAPRTSGRSGIRPRRLLEVAAAAAVIAALAVSPLLPRLLGRTTAPASGGTDTPAPVTPGPTAPEPDAKLGANGVYESKKLGLRLTFPAGFTGPTTDEQGNLVFTGGPIEVSVARRDRQPDKQVEDLLGDLVAANFKQSVRLKVTDLGVRTLAGRSAAMIHVSFVSAAAWFERETWAVSAGKSVYTVACGSTPGSQTSWEKAAPICSQILDSLEVGLEDGFISRAEAVKAALAAVEGDYEADVVTLDEQFEVPGKGKAAVWRMQLVARADGQVAWTVALDARTGKLVYLEDLIKGERKLP